MGEIQDLTGQKFGRLKVLNFAGLDRWHKGRWRCQCDCGAILPAVETHQLKSGKTKSCGCYRADMRHNKRTHGQAGSRYIGCGPACFSAAKIHTTTHLQTTAGAELLFALLGMTF